MSLIDRVRVYKGVTIFINNESYYKIRNCIRLSRYYGLDFITEDEAIEFIDCVVN